MKTFSAVILSPMGPCSGDVEIGNTSSEASLPRDGRPTPQATMPDAANRQTEVHLFLVWPNAQQVLDRIAGDIASNFTIKDVIDVFWSDELFTRNLLRFYSINLRDAAGKERECGRGMLRAYVVQDDAVQYARRETSKGSRLVNARVFDARARYRDWAGGGFRVHSSLSAPEAAHDLRILLDTGASDYLSRPALHNGLVQRRCTDLVGARGWRCWRQLVRSLDAVTPHVFLFGCPSPHQAYDSGGLPRVVILTEDRWDAVLILNGRRAGRDHGRQYYEATIGGQPVLLDLRQKGEGYFDPNWERDMLQRRTRVDGIPLLSDEDQLYATLYEGIVRSRGWMSPAEWSTAVASVAEPPVDGLTPGDLRGAVQRYFTRNGYGFVALKSPGVPVAGERMPWAWSARAALAWVNRAAGALTRHGLRESIQLAARRIQDRRESHGAQPSGFRSV